MSWREQRGAGAHRLSWVVGRRSLRGVADGVLTAFLSRNGDVAGYWGVGVLCRFALEQDTDAVELDLLASRVTPASHRFGALMDRGRDGLRRHLEALALHEDLVTEARVRISFELTDREHAASTRYRCSVTLVDDRGVAFERHASGWCWPHDPTRESRRVVTPSPADGGRR